MDKLHNLLLYREVMSYRNNNNSYVPKVHSASQIITLIFSVVNFAAVNYTTHCNIQYLAL